MRELNKSYKIFTVLLIFPFLAIRSFHSFGDDWAGYLGQARAIVENEHLNFLSSNIFNFENSISPSPPVNPWGYPLFVSLVYRFFGNNYLIFKLQQIFFIILFYLSLLIGFRGNLNLNSRLIFVSFFGLNIFFLDLLNEPISDYAYLTLSIFSIIGIFNIFEKKNFYFNKFIDVILISFLISFANLTREIGLTLYLTIFSIQIKNLFISSETKFLKEKKLFLNKNFFYNLLPYLIYFIFNFTFFKSLLPHESSFHFKEFSFINISIIFDNIFYYLKLPLYFFSNIPKIGVFFYISCLYPFLIGLISKNKDEFSFKIYVLIYLSVLLLFPHKQGIRFLYPVLPIFFYYVILGLGNIYNQKFNRSHLLKRIYNFIAIILIFNWSLSLYFYKSNPTNDGSRAKLPTHKGSSLITKLSNNKPGPDKYYSPFSNSFLQSIYQIKNFTDKDAKILFSKPRLIQYLTGRDSFEGFDIRQIYKADYFLHCKYILESKNFLNEINRTNEIKLESILNNDQFTLYKVFLKIPDSR